MKLKIKTLENLSKIVSAGVLSLLLPLPAFAAGICDTFTGELQAHPKLGDLFIFFTCFINRFVVRTIFAAALVVFIWGVVQYMVNAGNSEKREEGRKFIIWGLVAFFVMLSIWGIINILATTFGIDFVVPQ